MTNPNRVFSQQDLSGYDLSHNDLSFSNMVLCKLNGSNLTMAKLNGANLQQAQLYGANLNAAQLCGAQLLDVKLNGASLRRADLNGADLTGADLRRADLRKANLSNTNFSGANVQDAQFGGSTGLTDDVKRDLKNQGGIFKNDTSQEVTDLQWWLQYVVIPLLIACIGGSGIAAFFPGKTTKCLSSQAVSTSQLTNQENQIFNSFPTTK
ncbi:pentapeptide repeat-containing protein [Floridanema evergladense]|uniref:Pentapeptide repeat-containing protein n=1 Tax=Floridaenema evergladense BLCC-F167 TaxID=3153639 RepID=A0ABV4WSL6_9CYAN